MKQCGLAPFAYENGRKTPGACAVGHLSRALGVTAGYLLGLETAEMPYGELFDSLVVKYVQMDETARRTLVNCMANLLLLCKPAKDLGEIEFTPWDDYENYAETSCAGAD